MRKSILLLFLFLFFYLGTAEGSYFQRIQQEITADSNNSSTTNIASGDYFTGMATSTLGVAGIQVSLKSDVNCIVYVEQSPDGTNWDMSDIYNYYANGNFGITVQAINSYVRVRVKNNGSATTSIFRLQTSLCPIVEALPRSLDEDGHLQTSIHGIQDEYGFVIENTPIGEMRTVIPTRLVGAQFDGNTLDNNFWSWYPVNGGTVTQNSAQIILDSNTNTNGNIFIVSNRRARYVSANANVYRSVVNVTPGVVNNKRRWGVGWGSVSNSTVTDGAWFQTNGTTFNTVTMKGGTESVINTGQFNGNLGTTYSIPSSIKTYEIYWTNSSVWFTINGEILHHVTANTITWANTMNHYIFMDNTNSNTTINSQLECRVASIRRLGPLLTQPMSNYTSGQTAGKILKYGPGNLHAITIGGVANTSVVTLYDNTATSGTILWSSGAMPNNTNPFTIDMKGIPFSNGLTLTITAANCNATVIYE